MIVGINNNVTNNNKGNAMSEVDQKIQEAKEGKSILQNMVGEYSYYLVYLCDDFFLEKYKYNHETKQEELHGVECIDEATARFALTARFCNLVSA